MLMSRIKKRPCRPAYLTTFPLLRLSSESKEHRAPFEGRKTRRRSFFLRTPRSVSDLSTTVLRRRQQQRAFLSGDDSDDIDFNLFDNWLAARWSLGWSVALLSRAASGPSGLRSTSSSAISCLDSSRRHCHPRHRRPGRRLGGLLSYSCGRIVADFLLVLLKRAGWRAGGQASKRTREGKMSFERLEFFGFILTLAEIASCLPASPYHVALGTLNGRRISGPTGRTAAARKEANSIRTL
ncbi:Hypothetical predicted protein [Olea europaea subsp. europaea]|uniref:Uncharacterized protein n=1 Tax=Olea europaea subsp. europaea TaxID=158383 RepID=A0A8S0VMH4_OLEEU|nr:Hypothetical predicted protein [Olea europaea subsp. europaea]